MRRSLHKLPQRGTWQVAIAEGPDLGPGGPLGVGLVVDADSGDVLAADLVLEAEALADLAVNAAEQPLSGVPRRPRRLACRSEHALLLRRAASALGCEILRQEVLPAADAALVALAGHVQQVSEALPVTDLPWGQLLRRASQLAPWTALPDSVEFHLACDHDERLGGSVAIVLGAAGQQYGFTVYPSVQAHRQFLDLVYAPGGALGQAFDCWAVHFEPVEDIPDRDLVEMAHGKGLVHDGRMLSLGQYRDGQPGRMTPEVERAAFLAVQAVLQAWERHGDGLAWEDTETSVALQGGVRATVHTRRPGCARAAPGVAVREAAVGQDAFAAPAPGLFETKSHLAAFLPDGFYGEPPAAMIFKFAKADALRVAKQLSGLDRLLLVRGPDGATHVYGRHADHSLQRLGKLGARAVSPEQTFGLTELRLVVAKGGAKRRSYTKHDAAYSEVLPLLWPDDAGAEEVEGAAGLGFQATDTVALDLWNERDPHGLLRGTGWSGEIRHWPKASAVLHAFVAPLRPERVPEEALEPLYMVAATAWNGVVLADERGETEVLEKVLSASTQGLPSDGLMERMVARKRRFFDADSRILHVEGVRKEAGEIVLRVMWSPAHPGLLG